MAFHLMLRRDPFTNNFHVYIRVVGRGYLVQKGDFAFSCNRLYCEEDHVNQLNFTSKHRYEYLSRVFLSTYGEDGGAS